MRGSAYIRIFSEFVFACQIHSQYFLNCQFSVPETKVGRIIFVNTEVKVNEY